MLVLVLVIGAKAQTRMLSVGWEATQMYGSGANYWLQVNRDITITGYSITYSLYPWHNLSAAVLCTMSVGNSPWITPDLAHYAGASFPGIGDFSSSGQAPFEGDIVHGGIGPGADFVRAILKTNGVLPCVREKEAYGLSIQVKAGMWLISHMDGAGNDSMDCEVQGVIYYQ